MLPDTICTLTGQQYRAAYACKGVKDVRYYLNGIFISEHNEVVATNGSILYYAEIKPGDAIEPVIFNAIKLPANVIEVVISTYDENNIILTARDTSGTRQYICNRIDGKYPDYKALFAKQEEKEFHVIRWRAKYLALLTKVFGNEVLTFSIPNDNKCSAITCKNYGTVILMPCTI